MSGNETEVTVDINTGDPVDLDVDVVSVGASHWRTGRWLKNVIHSQRSNLGGLKDKPIGIMLTPSLARLVVDQQNAVNSPYPWGSDQVVADTSAPMPDQG